jgi:hypothetical protein
VKGEEMIKLKPCPFCGEEPYQQGFDYGYAIACVCGANGPGAFEDDPNGENEGVRLWNDRVLDEK